jgi:hypothetical protein
MLGWALTTHRSEQAWLSLTKKTLNTHAVLKLRYILSKYLQYHAYMRDISGIDMWP